MWFHMFLCAPVLMSVVFYVPTLLHNELAPLGTNKVHETYGCLIFKNTFNTSVFTKTGWMELQHAWRPSIFWAAEHNNKAKATHAETKDDGTEDMPYTNAPQSRCKARIFFFAAFLKNTGLFFISHLTMSIKVSRSHRGGLWEYNITRGSGLTYRSPVEMYPFLSTREQEEEEEM